MADNGENRQSIGERLLALRSKNNLTQEELAERLMVSRQSVSKWELSKTLPDVDKLIQLSEMYQVSMDYLIIGKQSGWEENGQGSTSVPEDADARTTANGQDERDVSSLQDNLDAQDGHNQEEDFNPQEDAKKKSIDRVIQRGSLLLCMFLSGTLCIVMMIFGCRLFAAHTFSTEDKKQDLAHVERVQEQYTKAEVTFVNDRGLFVDKHVWLDVPGVREGDYVYYYFDEKDPGAYSFEYYIQTLLLPVIVGIICLIFFITFCMEWRKTT